MRVAVGCLVCLVCMLCLVEPRYLPTRSGPHDRLTVLRQMIKHLLEEESGRDMGYEGADRLFRRDVSAQMDRQPPAGQPQTLQRQTLHQLDRPRKLEMTTDSLRTH